MLKGKYFIVFLIGFLLLPAGLVLASESVGAIDSTYKYAWSENLGWINFRPESGGLTITDSTVTGYAWSKDFGWINFAPTKGGVTNNCAGQLGGNAWSSQKGWLNLSGAVINSTGKITGLAGVAGSDGGRINFDCASCDVRTDWRPCANRTTSSVEGPSGHTSSGPAQIFNQSLANIRQQLLALINQFNLFKQKIAVSGPEDKVRNKESINKNTGGQSSTTTKTLNKNVSKKIEAPKDEFESRFIVVIEKIVSFTGSAIAQIANSFWRGIVKFFYPY